MLFLLTMKRRSSCEMLGDSAWGLATFQALMACKGQVQLNRGAHAQIQAMQLGDMLARRWHLGPISLGKVKLLIVDGDCSRSQSRQVQTHAVHGVAENTPS